MPFPRNRARGIAGAEPAVPDYEQPQHAATDATATDQSDSSTLAEAEPLTAAGFVPRTATKEKPTDYSAMRELANQNARLALDAHSRIGLHHVGKSDREVWREFASDPIRLRQTAAAIRAAIAAQTGDSTDASEIDDGVVEAPEGQLLTWLHRQRERREDR